MHRLHHCVLCISEHSPAQRLLAVPRLEQQICKCLSMKHCNEATNTTQGQLREHTTINMTHTRLESEDVKYEGTGSGLPLTTTHQNVSLIFIIVYASTHFFIIIYAFPPTNLFIYLFMFAP